MFLRAVMLKVKNSFSIEKCNTKEIDLLPSAPALPEVAITNNGFFLERSLHGQSENHNRFINKRMDE